MHTHGNIIRKRYMAAVQKLWEILILILRLMIWEKVCQRWTFANNGDS